MGFSGSRTMLFPMTTGSPRPPRDVAMAVVKRSTSMWSGVVAVGSDRRMDFWIPAAILVNVVVMLVGASVIKRRCGRWVYVMVVVEGVGVSTRSVV